MSSILDIRAVDVVVVQQCVMLGWTVGSLRPTCMDCLPMFKSPLIFFFTAPVRCTAVMLSTSLAVCQVCTP